MHITRANDDPEFREMANAVRLRAEDMFQLEGRSVWCLPLKQIETTPSIGRLYFRFDKTKVHTLDKTYSQVRSCLLTTSA